MAAFLVIAVAVPEAFGHDGVIFGAAYLALVLIHAGLFTLAQFGGSARAIWAILPFNLGLRPARAGRRLVHRGGRLGPLGGGSRGAGDRDAAPGRERVRAAAGALRRAARADRDHRAGRVGRRHRRGRRRPAARAGRRRDRPARPGPGGRAVVALLRPRRRGGRAGRWPAWRPRAGPGGRCSPTASGSSCWWPASSWPLPGWRPPSRTRTAHLAAWAAWTLACRRGVYLLGLGLFRRLLGLRRPGCGPLAAVPALACAGLGPGSTARPRSPPSPSSWPGRSSWTDPLQLTGTPSRPVIRG